MQHSASPASRPNLSSRYLKGAVAFQRGDYTAALKEWRPLAARGDAVAQFNLGNSYRLGQGVPRDYVLAHLWFSLSAAKGFKNALKARDTVAKLMTPVQIAEAQKMAREWREQHKKK